MGLIVDNFAGGGGASTGIELAGYRVDIAINHDPAAIAMHKANHPHTRHYCENIWMVDPREACGGQPVDLAWFSPDCKHFSKAKGGALIDRNIRGLAWVVLRWAGTVRPTVMIVENVEEFPTWGPVRKGKPVKSKAGTTYRQWIRQLEALGYHIERRELVAADYGTPTSRRRTYIIMRCDGMPIIWPEPTHGKPDTLEVAAGLLKPWRTAAEIIDWSLPCPSIFATREEIKAQYGINAVRPLAAATMKRIAKGADKFTIKNDRPFIVPVGYGERKGQAPRVHDVDAPMSTIVSSAKQYVCKPELAPISAASMMAIGQTGGGDRVYGCDDPLRTLVSKAEQCMQETVLAPYIMVNNNSWSEVNASSVEAPLRTLTTGRQHLLCAPSLIQYPAEKSEHVRGQSLDDPLMTVDARPRYGLSMAYLSEYYGNAQDGIDLNDPMRTVTTKEREALTLAHIEKYYSGGYSGCGSAADEPIGAVTSRDHNALCATHIIKYKGTNLGQPVAEPLQTLTAMGNEFGVVRTVVAEYEPGRDLHHWPEVRNMLNEYCGYHLADNEILLLNLRGAWWFIADIGLRMITPREAFDAQGFPADYIIDRDYEGNPYPKSEQMAKAGNSVCPPVAAALVRANHPAAARGRIAV